MNVPQHGRWCKGQSFKNRKKTVDAESGGIAPDAADAAAAIGLERLRRSDDPLMQGIGYALEAILRRLDAVGGVVRW